MRGCPLPFHLSSRGVTNVRRIKDTCRRRFVTLSLSERRSGLFEDEADTKGNDRSFLRVCRNSASAPLSQAKIFGSPRVKEGQEFPSIFTRFLPSFLDLRSRVCLKDSPKRGKSFHLSWFQVSRKLEISQRSRVQRRFSIHSPFSSCRFVYLNKVRISLQAR